MPLTVLANTHTPPQHLREAGDELFERNEWSAALEKYEELYSLQEQQNNSLDAARTLHKIGQVYHELLAPEAATTAYEKALSTLNTLGETPGNRVDINILRADVLYAWGYLAYDFAGKDKAYSLLERIVELSSTAYVKPDTLGLAFYGLGLISEDTGYFIDSIDFYTKAAAIFEEAQLTEDQGNTLVSIGNVWTRLGELEKARDIYHQASTLDFGNEHSLVESDILDNLGVLNFYQENYWEALQFYQRALEIKETLNDNLGLSQTLNNIGAIYTYQDNFPAALQALERALVLTPTTDKGTIINIRDTLGTVYKAVHDDGLAWQNYHRALRLSIDDRERRRRIISTIHLAQLVRPHQPLLAIAFYKRAINDIEQIRANVRSLPLETQRRYTDTVADSYRELAALLLEQERVFEAQQVLDLLKIQELEDYFHDVRADQPTVSEKLPYLEPERTLLTQHRALLLQGPSDIETALSLADFLQNPDVARALDQLQEGATLKPDSLKQLQKDLKTLPHESAVLYPLILNDRLELLLIPKTGDPIHKTTWLAKHQLEEQVTRLRKNISDPSEDIRATAGALHEAIIAPLQTELQKLKIDNIIYIPDGVLHYIPLSVLYNQADGQWLAETYSSYNLTTSEMSDLVNPPQRPFNALAAAFTDTEQTFEKFVDQTTTNFNGLFYADREVSFLKDKLPDTQILLNADFNRNNLETQLKEQNILHLATHAAFIPGQPENSFILLGDGDTITLKELRHLSLPSVDLVVLSACQTGISYIADGVEILGMGFQVQRTEARAALASLWWVDDRTTSQLMALFYDALTQGKTKAEALQNAQRQLIDQGREEPYYWAPFVLIGNGL